MNTEYENIQDVELGSISSRTIGKILMRANKSCGICGWDRARCDLHHIVHVQDGGGNEEENLCVLCPNCHRAVHELGDSFATKEDLVRLSVKYRFPDWRDYFNPKRSSKFSYRPSDTACGNVGCTSMVPYFKTYCSAECSHQGRQKVEWDRDELVSRLKEFNGVMTRVGKSFGVSDNAVRKVCRRLDIDYKQYRIRRVRF